MVPVELNNCDIWDRRRSRSNQGSNILLPFSPAEASLVIGNPPTLPKYQLPKPASVVFWWAVPLWAPYACFQTLVLPLGGALAPGAAAKLPHTIANDTFTTLHSWHSIYTCWGGSFSKATVLALTECGAS